jgi:beta-glucanase (GH16 family)
VPLAVHPVAHNPSWKLVVRETFSGSALPKGCGAYGPSPHGGPAASWYDPAQARVSKGLLHLRITRKRGFDRPYATGGVGCWSLARTYGRFEVRAKVPKGKGIDSYLVLWPVQGDDDRDWSGIELLAPRKERAYLTNGDGTRKHGKVVPGTYTDAFHTYRFDWTPRSFAIRVDGKVVFRDTAAFAGKRWLGMAVSSGDNLTGLPNAATKIPSEFAVDWIKIYAYQA